MGDNNVAPRRYEVSLSVFVMGDETKRGYRRVGNTTMICQQEQGNVAEGWCCVTRGVLLLRVSCGGVAQGELLCCRSGQAIARGELLILVQKS